MNNQLVRFSIVFSLVFLLVLTSFSSAQAQKSEVLPKGVYRYRLIGVFTQDVKDEFASDGKFHSLASPFNSSVSAQDFAKREPRLASLVNALNSLAPNLGDELLLANLFSEVTVSQKRYMATLEKGLTAKLSVGVVVPVVQRSFAASLEATSVNNASAIGGRLGELSPDISAGLRELSAQRLDGTFFKNRLFREKGYIFPDQAKTQTDIGDVETGLKYRYHRSKKSGHSLGAFLRLPTGRVGPLDNVFDPGSGAGKWTLGLAHYDDFHFARKSILSFENRVQLSLPQRRFRAVPVDELDVLPSLLPEDGQVLAVKESSAPNFYSEIGWTGRFLGERWILNSLLSYEIQSASRFSGPSNFYFQGMEENTAFRKLNAELAIGFSTLQSVISGRGRIPLQLFLRYNRMLDGAGTQDVGYIRTDLHFFFD